MKFRIFAAGFLVLSFVQIGFSQSGRKVENVKTETAKQDDAVQEAVCNENNAIYKYLAYENIKDFSAELNRLGKCGYRLEFLTKLFSQLTDQPKDADLLAIVKLEPGNKFEYDWFETSSGFEAAGKLNEKAAKGFYFRKNVQFVIDRCDEKKPEQTRRSEEESSVPGVISYSRELAAVKGSIYFVERKNGAVKKNEYQTLSAGLGFGEKSDREVQPKFDELIARNFRPVAITYLGSLYQYSVLMEKDAELKNENDYRFIREEFGFKKKINQLAKEGFAPLFSGITFAVLQRNRNLRSVNEFVAADNYKAITKMFAKTPQTGGIYFAKGLSDYDCVEPSDSYLFVGKPLVDNGTRYEYKTLSMVNIWNLRKGENFSIFPTKEKIEQFYAALESGYEIRELFTAGEVFVLFERKIKSGLKF